MKKGEYLLAFIFFIMLCFGCGKTGKDIATVSSDRVLSRITVNPQLETLQVGQDITFNATGYDSNGLVIPITPSWSVSPELGIIGNTGIFTAKIVGTCEITAAYNNVRGKAIIVINEGAPANLYSIEITPSFIELKVGAIQQFYATGFDKGHKPVSITPFWSATGAGVIEQTTGRFTAQVPGGGKIIAKTGNIKGEASVVVTEELPEL